VGAAVRSLGSRLSRTKHIPKGDLTTNLKRCLNTFDITMIGVGHMIGAGIFVTTGEVMRNLAGPSTTISYIISGLAALLSALCYAEFGARYPKAGSAYTYAYVGCGEIWAFIIGWNIILEHVLSAAAVGRTFAGYVDDLAHSAVRNWTVDHVRPWPWNTVSIPEPSANVSHQICVDAAESGAEQKSLIGYYPDFISVAIIMGSALFVGLGSKAASNFNSVFSLANLLVIVFVVGYGITFAHFQYWEHFFPCGVNGVLAGASKCFFAYIGFDGLATAGEEAKDPTKMIPKATYYSMAIVTACYVLMSATLSLMRPYYELPASSVYSKVFSDLNAPTWVPLVISIGALLGILTSLIGALFSLPRSVYAMAEDGLIFGWWARVNPWTKTPLNATITFTILAAIIAMTFDLDALVDFLSIGTILAYTIVAAALILLRYRPHPVEDNPSVMDQGGQIRRNIPFLYEKMAGMKPGNSILYSLVVMMIAFTGIGVLLSTQFVSNPIGIVLMVIFVLISIACVLFIDAHQQNSMKLDYKVFLVPYLPSASLLINILMMTQLTVNTWIR
ncbi:hypothetical protein PMAYCL1PPCAC_05585, partial [Pristionchus mayeri]